VSIKPFVCLEVPLVNQADRPVAIIARFVFRVVDLEHIVSLASLYAASCNKNVISAVGTRKAAVRDDGEGVGPKVDLPLAATSPKAPGSRHGLHCGK
jgi:hypothetical protein